MRRLALSALGVHTPRRRVGPATPVGPTENRVRIVVDRSEWTVATRMPDPGDMVLVVACEVSYDGGATWAHLVGAGMRGGELYDKRGSKREQATVASALRPEIDGIARLVRVVTDARMPLRTAVSLDIYEGAAKRRGPDPANSPTLEDFGTGEAASVDNVTCGINPASTNRLLVVDSVGGRAAGASLAPTVTLGATSVPDQRVNLSYGTYYRLNTKTLTAPDTGEDTVTVTWAATQTECGVIASAYSDVDQTTPVEGVQTASGPGVQTASVTVTSETGDTVHSVLGTDGGTSITDDDGGTKIAELVDIYYATITSSYDTGAASVDRGYSWTGYAAYALGAFNMNAGGGTAYSLSCEAGAFAVNGTAANLEHHQEVSAEAGSFVVTGTAADLEFGLRMDAETVAYAVTGQAANLERHSVVSAESGTYAWTGTDATLTHVQPATLDAEAGSYTVTGADVSFALVRVGDPGSYVITGTDADLRYGFRVDAEAGSYAVTGAAMNPEFHRALSAEAATYAWTGTAANLEHHRVLAAEAGSYVVTGTAAGLESGLRVSAESGSFVVTGVAANLEHHRAIAASAGSFVVTGADATLTYTVGIELFPIKSKTGPSIDGSMFGPSIDGSMFGPSIQE